MEEMKQQERHTIQYLTAEASARLNGERHLERAIAYISAGYPDRFADGSLRKAKRNFKLAEDLKIPDWIINTCAHILVDLEKSILEGDPNQEYPKGLKAAKRDARIFGLGIIKDGERISLEDIYLRHEDNDCEQDEGA